MTDIQTDTTEVVILVKAHGNINIENLQCPTYSWIGETFNIEYDANNLGGEDNCYFQVKKGNTILDRQEALVTNNRHIIHSCIIDVIGNLTLTIEVGYKE